MKKYFGPLSFYLYTLSKAIPIGLQNLITSCMGIIDSLMVAWIGQVSAVGTATQLETLSSSVSWACAVGVGIYSVQFFGAKDYKKLKQTTGLSFLLAAISGLFWFLLAAFFGQRILGFYINDPAVIQNGWAYLRIVMFSYIFLAFEFVFNTVYRNIGKPNVPLYVGIVSMLINVVTNYTLIFGRFGMPELGIQGAALGTLFAHGFAIIFHFIYAYKTKQVFIGSFKEMFSFDLHFVQVIMKKTFSMMLNELCFGFGSTLFIKAFGILGTNSMDAYYVGAKISDIFYAFSVGFSNAVAQIIGYNLGAGLVQKAKQEGDYLISMATGLSVFFLVFIFIFSPVLVSIFDLSDPFVYQEAVSIVKVFALRIALRFFIVIIFSSLRAGGDANILMLLDSGLMWGVGIPLAFISVYVFGITSISMVFLICQLEQAVRVVFGMMRYQSGKWANNLTNF